MNFNVSGKLHWKPKSSSARVWNWVFHQGSFAGTLFPKNPLRGSQGFRGCFAGLPRIRKIFIDKVMLINGFNN